jgi:hypothetical protein
MVTMRVSTPGGTCSAFWTSMCVAVSFCSASITTPFGPMRWFTANPFGIATTVAVAASAAAGSAAGALGGIIVAAMNSST